MKKMLNLKTAAVDDCVSKASECCRECLLLQVRRSVCDEAKFNRSSRGLEQLNYRRICGIYEQKLALLSCFLTEASAVC